MGRRVNTSVDYGIPIIRARDAKARGLTRYFSGNLCQFGHISERMVSNGACLTCLKEKSKPYIHANHKRRRKIDEEFHARTNHHLRESKKRRLARDPMARVAHSIRSRVSFVVANIAFVKVGSGVRDLGCTIEELRIHLEEKFRDGMTWENYGDVWHVDHVKPLVSFDLSDRNQFLMACHYTNLQPLLVEENYSKGCHSMEEWQSIRQVTTPLAVVEIANRPTSANGGEHHAL